LNDLTGDRNPEGSELPVPRSGCRVPGEVRRVVDTDVEKDDDVRVLERGDGAIEPYVARAVHLSLPTCADLGGDLIGAEAGTCGQGHVARRRSDYTRCRVCTDSLSRLRREAQLRERNLPDLRQCQPKEREEVALRQRGLEGRQGTFDVLGIERATIRRRNRNDVVDILGAACENFHHDQILGRHESNVDAFDPTALDAVEKLILETWPCQYHVERQAARLVQQWDDACAFSERRVGNTAHEPAKGFALAILKPNGDGASPWLVGQSLFGALCAPRTAMRLAPTSTKFSFEAA